MAATRLTNFLAKQSMVGQRTEWLSLFFLLVLGVPLSRRVLREMEMHQGNTAIIWGQGYQGTIMPLDITRVGLSALGGFSILAVINGLQPRHASKIRYNLPMIITLGMIMTALRRVPRARWNQLRSQNSM